MVVRYIGFNPFGADIGSAEIADDSIVNADINTGASISYSKLAALTSSQLLVGNASNVAVDVAVTGDFTISNSGVTAIASAVIVNADVNASAAIAYSKLAALTDGNILVGNVSNVAVSVNPSGDVDISNTGAFSIASDVVVNADVNSAAAIAYSKLAALTSANLLVGNVSNVATVTAVTGDVTIGNTGVTAIGADKVTEAMMATDAIGLTELKAGTDGELFTFDTSGNPAFVAAGTAGQFLKSQGAGSVPLFAAAAAGGDMVKIASGTGSVVGDATEQEAVSFSVSANDYAVGDLLLCFVVQMNFTGTSDSVVKIRVADGTNTFTSNGDKMNGNGSAKMDFIHQKVDNVTILSQAGLTIFTDTQTTEVDNGTATMISNFLAAALTVSIRVVPPTGQDMKLRMYLYNIKA